MRSGAHFGDDPRLGHGARADRAYPVAVQRLLVITTAALSITASAVAAPAKAPAPYGAVRACLVRHGFAISHEAHGPRIGWEFNASAKWKVAGKGQGSDDAMVVVGGSIADAKSY